MAYIAKIKSRVLNENRYTIFVNFIDGDHIVTEDCTPQDKTAFDMWVKSRIEFWNSTKELDQKYSDGDDVVIDEGKPDVPVLSAEHIARNAWIKDYERWVKIKTTLIDTGILTGAENPLINLKNKVKNNFIADYINYI